MSLKESRAFSSWFLLHVLGEIESYGDASDSRASPRSQDKPSMNIKGLIHGEKGLPFSENYNMLKHKTVLNVL